MFMKLLLFRNAWDVKAFPGGLELKIQCHHCYGMGLIAMVWVWLLAQELLHAMGVAKINK